MLKIKEFVTDYRDDQHSPQSMGAIQHQAPDTTSPSPPHAYSMNGSAVPNTNGFPSTMLPQGKIINRNVSILLICILRYICFTMGTTTINGSYFM
jgi:hypothetical protein